MSEEIKEEQVQEQEENLEELESKELAWSISAVWNRELILGREEWSYKARSHIRSSELGLAFRDRWYRMRGIPASDPPDARTLRKFEAGHLFEWLVGQVLQKAGLVAKHNDFISVKLPGCAEVKGAYDYLVEPPKNWGEARENVRSMNYPRNLERISFKLVDYLQEKLPIIYGADDEQAIGMKRMIYEIKSVNSMVFWSRVEILKKGYPHHRLQLFSYLEGKGILEGRLFYISKDDLTTIEAQVLLEDEETKEAFRKDVELMTEYTKSDNLPPKENDLEFDEKKGKWKLNWKLEWSNYLTMITGMDKDSWKSQAGKEMRRLNSQIKDGKELEKLQEEIKGKEGDEKVKMEKEIKKTEKRMAKREEKGWL